MTQPATYSLEKADLTPSGTIGADGLTVTASTSLMTNYLPSRAVDADRRMEVIEDVNGEPIVFSVGTNGHLYAVMRTRRERSGWAQRDLSEALGGAGQVETFAVQALPGRRFAVVLSLNDGTASTVYATAALDADPDAAFWSDFAGRFVHRPGPAGLRKVSQFTTGPGQGQDTPTVIATASADGLSFDRYVVQADPGVTGPEGVWTLWPLPQDAHRQDGGDPILDVVIGRSPRYGLTGTYALYRVGDDLALTFDSLELVNGQQVSTRIEPVPDGARALVAVDTEGQGMTDLFVAGNGVFRFDLTAQKQRSAAQLIAGGLVAGEDTELEVLCDGTSIAVWVLNGGELTSLTGAVGEAAHWTTPMPIKRGVSQICALRNETRSANELFDVDAGAKLAYFYQDPVSTIWRELEVPLSDTGRAKPVDCYTTVLHFETGRGAPLRGETVTVSATGWIHATINGQAHVLDPGSEVQVRTDARGAVTFVTEVHSLSAPVLTVSAAAFSEKIDISPQGVINAGLKGYTTPGAVEAARTQSGAVLMAGDSRISAADFAAALGRLTAACDAASPSGMTLRRGKAEIAANIVRPARLRRSGLQPLAVTGLTSGRTQAMVGMDALALVPALDPVRPLHPAASLGGTIDTVFGDLWSALMAGLRTVTDFVVHELEDGLHFVVHLAEGVATFLLDTVEKIFEALDWIVSQAGIALKKLIDWMGQLLDWNDVLLVQKVIVNGTNRIFDWTVQEIATLESVVDRNFDRIAQAFTGAELPGRVADQDFHAASTGLVAGQPGNVQALADFHKSPAGSFATYHVQHSGPADGGVTVQQQVSRALSDFLGTVETAGRNFGETFRDVFEDLARGLSGGEVTLDRILGRIAGDLVRGLLKTARDLIDGLLDVVADLVGALKTLLNTTIEIPFLSGLFRTISGGADMTILNVTSLIVAVPATVLARLTGAGQFLDKLGPLARPDQSPQEFMALVGGGPKRADGLGVMAEAEDGGERPSETALAYNYIGGLVSVFAEIIDDTVDVAGSLVAHVASPLEWLQVLCKAVISSCRFPAIPGAAQLIKVIGWGAGLIGIAAALMAAVNPASGVIEGPVELFLGFVEVIFAIAAGVLEGQETPGDSLFLIPMFGEIAGGLGAMFNGLAAFDPEEDTKAALETAAMIGMGLSVLLSSIWMLFAICERKGRPI